MGAGVENHEKVFDEVKKHFATKALEERADQFEAENKELRLSNQLLESQFFAQRSTQADILKTLHANLDENYTKIEEYDIQVEQLRNQLEESAQEHKDELELHEAESNLRIQELLAKTENLQNSLDQVRDYMKRQKEVDSAMEDMRQREKEDKENHARDLSAMDRKKAVEIDQLKKDMLQKIKETRETLRLKTKEQLDTTTKRTIMENEQMTTELAFQSREMEKLLQKNNLLIEENENLKRNVSIHKELERELARRTHVYQKLIKKLNEEKNKLDERREEETKEVPAANTQELEDLRKELAQVHHDFSEYRNDHQTLTQLQDEATRVIIATLYDLKNKAEEPGNTDDAPGGFSLYQREQFLRLLLEKLNTSLCSSCVPAAPQSPVKLPKISKYPSVCTEASTAMESRGMQTSGDDDTIRVQASMWSWTSGCAENFSKAEVVRGPVREWGYKSRTLAKRLGRS